MSKSCWSFFKCFRLVKLQFQYISHELIASKSTEYQTIWVWKSRVCNVFFTSETSAKSCNETWTVPLYVKYCCCFLQYMRENETFMVEFFFSVYVEKKNQFKMARFWELTSFYSLSQLQSLYISLFLGPIFHYHTPAGFNPAQIIMRNLY